MKNGITNIIILPFVTCLLFFACTQEQKTSPKVEIEKPSSAVVTEESLSTPSNTSLTILIFRAERRLEIWSSSSTPQRLADLAIIKLQAFPVGAYLLQSSSKKSFSLSSSSSRQAQQATLFHRYPLEQDLTIGIEKEANIQLSSQSYLQFTEQLAANTASQVLIFPNDSRTSGKFLACYSCPHWMAEVYAQLELELRAFSL